ncbi:MAG TPA: hypothetical protein VG222_03070 [Vicinamibacterales bacterium]|jgi:hypothetical protein|nr:hypothetical protein [Vicinamibacterales bacterium]
MDRISTDSIQAALNEEDVERLLELGAPADEYRMEAEMIAGMLANIGGSDCSEDRVIAIISAVWGRMFDGSASALELRRPIFQRVARRILGLGP